MSNIQQKVYDAFPAFPRYTTIHALWDKFPNIDVNSVKNAIWRLIAKGMVERDNERRFNFYRLRKGAKRPIDMRGHHGNSGRKRKCPSAHTL